jgi:hypothetical protein
MYTLPNLGARLLTSWITDMVQDVSRFSGLVFSSNVLGGEEKQAYQSFCLFYYYYYYYFILTAIGLTPGGNNTVHIYTQTTHTTKHT